MAIDPNAVTWDDDIQWDDAAKPDSALKQFASAAIRPIAKGVAALPLMAMDAGVGTRNAITGERYELPSSMFNKALDAYTTQPEGMGKVAEFVSSSLVGSRLPAPQSAAQAPAQFNNARQMMRTNALQAGQKEGYVVPPSANNPTVFNRVLEGIAGKDRINKEAVIRNETVTARLASKGVGQSADAPLNQGALAAIRSEAHAAGYEPLKALGTITPDQTFVQSLNAVGTLARGAQRMGVASGGGHMGPPSPDHIAQTLIQRGPFDSADAVDTISYLREMADDAFRSGRSLDGKGYKAVAKALEDQIERHLASQGEQGAPLLKAYRDARTLMAKTYTAGKALVEDTGLSKARTYGAELQRGKPLTGDQRTIARFAQSFGKYVPNPTGENFPALSPIDAYGAAGVAGVTDSALPLLYPLTRIGLRDYLLSPAGQARALPQAYRTPETLGLLGAFAPLSQGLLRQ